MEIYRVENRNYFQYGRNVAEKAAFNTIITSLQLLITTELKVANYTSERDQKLEYAMRSRKVGISRR